ncbi:oxidoreductase [Leptospira kobayashii]|uniref:Oxidoreductase n=1 Tax=Leptospira kobayashii TaxID=1917830 RepID=A0ABM7UFN4_9LEPT|nr:ferredoxin reductase [Leptospira kobayashii]BDA77386.1 oxidoreductase [Leptospira kobayashii]
MKVLPFIYNSPKEYWNYFQPTNWLEFVLGEINPLYSVSTAKAKVIAIHSESADAKTIVLQTNRHWKGFQAGQHVPVTVEIAGRRVTRYYSLSSSPSAKNPTITVKRQKGGLVSNFLNDRLKVGDVIELGQASGEFTIDPSALPDKLLFIAGGSGITPIHSIIKTLAESNYKGQAKLLYFSRFKEDIIFFQSFAKLETGNSWLEVKHVLTDVPSPGYESGFLTTELMDKFVPDLKERLVYLCGPAPLQTSAKEFLKDNQVISELFLLPTQIQTNYQSSGPVEVVLLQSHKTVLLKGEKSILEELEDQGIYPPSGCRMGICHTCTCRKTSGSVTNIKDETMSDSGEGNIQLCLSRVDEKLELDF